ncbi:MAG: hypothetical protein RID91_09850 [Azospirillaceae bacterium]
MESLLEFLRTPVGASLIYGAITVYPYARILARAGRRPALAVLVFVPLIGQAIVLAVLAVKPWPTALPAAGGGGEAAR